MDPYLPPPERRSRIIRGRSPDRIPPHPDAALGTPEPTYPLSSRGGSVPGVQYVRHDQFFTEDEDCAPTTRMYHLPEADLSFNTHMPQGEEEHSRRYSFAERSSPITLHPTPEPSPDHRDIRTYGERDPDDIALRTYEREESPTGGVYYYEDEHSRPRSPFHSPTCAYKTRHRAHHYLQENVSVCSSSRESRKSQEDNYRRRPQGVKASSSPASIVSGQGGSSYMRQKEYSSLADTSHQEIAKPRQPKQLPLIEISPGVRVPLRGAAETKEFIRRDQIIPAACFACSQDMFCISDASFVLCPSCRVVNPLTSQNEGADDSYIVGGVALGCTYEELFNIQSAILAERTS